jgi:hypothetical protein
MDERYDIRLNDAIRNAPPIKISYADISIIITYKPWFILIRREKEFRFTTITKGDGKLSWFSRPVEK